MVANSIIFVSIRFLQHVYFTNNLATKRNSVVFCKLLGRKSSNACAAGCVTRLSLPR